MADDIFTQDTVDKLNASALTFNEVVTSRAGGVSTGSLIDQTLTPLGEVIDTLKGRFDKIGTTFADWGSTEGGTLTSAAQAFLNNTVGSAGIGNYYAWTGAFPHIVTPGLDPASIPGYAIRSNAQFFSAVTQTNDGASVSEPSLDDLRDIVRRDTAGYTLIGNTTLGCTVTAERQTVKVLANGNEYEWTGALPKVVAPGTDPTADPLWVPRTDVLLRNELASAGGAELIGTASGKTVQETIKITPQVFSDIASVSGSDVLVGDHISVDGVLYVISDSIPNGGVVSPDCHLIGSGKYAVKSLSAPAKRSGVFTTNPALGHRVGDIKYLKRGEHCKLLTDLSKYMPNINKDLAGTVAYVDASRPDNDGDGLTWATAKKSLISGFNLNTDILFVRAGLYSRPERLLSFTLSKDRAIIAVGGPVVQGSTVRGVWSKTPGYTNVYQIDYESGLTNITSAVFDTARLNANGAPSRYDAKASISEVDALEGRWFHSGTTTYVHAIGSRDLTMYGSELRVLQPVAGPVITWGGDYKLYMEGIESWYAGTGGSNCVTLTSDGNVHLGSAFYSKNCAFNGCRDGNGGNGLAVRDIGMCISDGSRCQANRRDGFNYHYGMVGGGNTTLAPHYIEIDCVANGNGDGGSEGNNQGSTAHENCVGFRIGGDYSGHSDGGCIVDIDASKCHIVNASCNNSGVVGALLSADPWAGAPGVTAEWWVDGMYLSGNTDIANARGDLAMDGYNSIVHYVDVISDKPISTRSFSVSPDDAV